MTKSAFRYIGPLVAFGALLCAAPKARSETGASMAQKCMTLAHVQVGADRSFAWPTDQDSGICWGAFAVIQQVLSAQIEYPEKCIVPDRRRLIEIFVRFVDKNPQLNRMDFMESVIGALDPIYHCQ
jgi:hypothetical protein